MSGSSGTAEINSNYPIDDGEGEITNLIPEKSYVPEKDKALI